MNRRLPALAALLALALPACTRTRTPADAPVRPQPGGDSAFVLLHLDPGSRRVGTNELRATVRNRTDAPLPFGLSIRAESPGYAVQKGHYRLLQPRETAELRYAYELPDEGYRLLIAYYGRVTSMPTEQEPYPGFVERQLERFALFAPPEVESGGSAAPASEPPNATRAASSASEAARERLRELLGWDRTRANDPNARTLRRDSIGPYRLEEVRIDTEPGHSIGLLLLRRPGACRAPATVLYLTGNPPGRKESGIVPGMFLADRGLQVAALDRRESARHTGRGEYLSATADPVFDARVALDYLAARNDVDSARIGLLGFSKGAEEGMFAAVLHRSVKAAALLSRLVQQDSLFRSAAWLPTLYSEDILHDLGLASQIDDWDALTARITPEVSAAALAAYRRRYPWFDSLDPAAVLPLLAPRPVLVRSGERDSQIGAAGVRALRQRAAAAYQALGAGDRADVRVVPGSGHALSAAAMAETAGWLARRLGAGGGC